MTTDRLADTWTENADVSIDVIKPLRAKPWQSMLKTKRYARSFSRVLIPLMSFVFQLVALPLKFLLVRFLLHEVCWQALLEDAS